MRGLCKNLQLLQCNAFFPEKQATKPLISSTIGNLLQNFLFFLRQNLNFGRCKRNTSLKEMKSFSGSFCSKGKKTFYG